MKKAIPYLFLAVFLSLCGSSKAGVLPDGSIGVYLKNGHVDVFPADVLKSHQEVDGQWQLTLMNDSVVSYLQSEVDSLGGVPTNFPTLTSFKFNNKFNENVYLDVFGTIADNKITASVGAIGKRLTPSFKVSDPNTLVYVDGVLQESKVSRLRFDKPITYTATYPGYRKMFFTKLKDEIWSEGTPGGPLYEEIPLMAEQLSTNAPSNYPDREGLDKVVDGDEYTFFHSTWGSGEYEKLPLTEHPYIQISLAEELNEFVFRYVTRPDNDSRNPKAFLVQGSKDQVTWTDLVTLTEADGIPGFGRAQEYISPVIKCNEAYSYLRFTMTDCAYKNYLALTEFSLSKYLGESEGTAPELISPAVYDYAWKPFGRDYEVKVDWLADADTASVPSIHIDIENAQEVVNKTDYLKAKFIVDGGNVFPDMTDSVLIKGRGNSTWQGPGGKNPYRLKFATAVKPFGLTKGKNWVLLANSMTGAMLTNAIGMKIARMVGTAGANDIIPVDLYINGSYRGSYNFTQHVGLHNNSVDIDETNAVLLELDSYGGDLFSFTTSPYGMNANVKDPDLDEIPAEEAYVKFNQIQTDFNALCQKLLDGENIDDRVDSRMLARYFLVNELIDNEELNHPKSCFLYREDLLAKHSKYIFGPVWDLDWAFGYEGTYQYCNTTPEKNYFGRISSTYRPGGRFYNHLRTKSDYLKRCYYKVWTDFMNQHLVELQEYIDDYYAFAAPSLERNASVWWDGFGYDEDSRRFKEWLTKRAEYIYSTLDVYDLDTPLPIERGDVNKDGAITLADVICVYNYLLGLENETFDSAQADANENGEISVADVVWIVGWAMQAEFDATRHMDLPKADAMMNTRRFTALLGQTSEVPLTLSISEGQYVAAQFDVTLPQEMTLEDVILPEVWKDYQVEFAEKDNHEYRVAIYSAQGGTFPIGAADIKLLVNTELTVEHSERVVTLQNVTLVNAQGEDERMSGKSAQFDMEVTGIEDATGKEAVSGGAALNVETLADGEIKVYTVDGRLFRVCPVTVGQNSIDLPTGVYIVNRQKIVINK